MGNFLLAYLIFVTTAKIEIILLMFFRGHEAAILKIKNPYKNPPLILKIHTRSRQWHYHVEEESKRRTVEVKILL